MNCVYVINPKLLIYPKNVSGKRVFVAEINSGKPPLIINSFLVAKGIIEIPTSFSKISAFTYWHKLGIDNSDLYILWDELFYEKIILSMEEYERDYADFEEWQTYQWQEAYRYHYATKDYPFLQMDTVEGVKEDSIRMKSYSDIEQAPSCYITHQSIKKYPLDKVTDNDLDQDISSLSSKERKGLKGMSILFDLCFGKREKMEFKNQGIFLNKAIPSGGARHPTEMYLFVFNHAELESGLYHYNVNNNSLDLIKKGLFKNQCKKATYDLFNRYEGEPFGMIVFTSLYSRAMWRYRDARSWRAVLIDIGHALMIFRKVSTVLGIRSYTYQKFDDSMLHELMGLDPIKQTALYVGSIS